VLSGGKGVDTLIASGERQPDIVDGGPDFDTAFLDVLVEMNVVGVEDPRFS
jgi:hypothetical protein